MRLIPVIVPPFFNESGAQKGALFRGFWENWGKLASKLNVYEVRSVLPKIGPGMITKVYAATEAVKNGVKEASIASGLIESPLSDAIGHTDCTVISN